MADKQIKIKITSQIDDFVKDISKVQKMIDDLQSMKTSGQLTDPTALAKVQQVCSNLSSVMNKAQADMNTIPEIASAFGGYTGSIKKVIDDAVVMTNKSQSQVSALKNVDRRGLDSAMSGFVDRTVDSYNDVIDNLATIGSQTLDNADVVALRKLRTHKYITTGSQLSKSIKQLEQALDTMNAAERRIAIDTEGTSEIRQSGKDGLRTVQMKVKGQIPIVIDADRIPESELKPMWDLLSKDHTKIIHNAQFETDSFNRLGKPMNGKIQDTLIFARDLAKLYSFLGESTITENQGQSLDKLMNTLVSQEKYANIKNIFPFEKFSKDLRYGNEKNAGDGPSRWSALELPKDLQTYSIADVEALPELMDFLDELYNEAIKKVFSPEAAAKAKAQLQQKMNEWPRKSASRQASTSDDVLARDEVQYDIKRSIASVPRSDNVANALPQAFQNLQRATTDYKTGVYKLVGKTRDVVAHMVTNSNEVDSNLWNRFESMETATRSLHGSDKFTKDVLLKYINIVKDFSQSLPMSSLKSSLQESLKGVNTSSTVGKLKIAASDVINTWSASIEEAIRLETLKTPTFAYKGIKSLPGSEKDMRSTIGELPTSKDRKDAALSLHKVLSSTLDEYNDSINKAIPYLDSDTSDITNKMQALHRAINNVDRSLITALRNREDALRRGDTAAAESSSLEIQRISTSPGINGLAKSFLESAKQIKTDNPVLQGALNRIPAELDQLGNKALTYVVDVVSAIDKHIEAIGTPRHLIAEKYVTKPLQQVNLPDIEASINSTKEWRKITPYSDTQVQKDQAIQFATQMQAISDAYTKAKNQTAAISEVNVEGLKEPLQVVGSLPVKFREIIDDIFKKEQKYVEEIAIQLGAVEQQLNSGVLDKDSLANAGITKLDKISNVEDLTSVKSGILKDFTKAANQKGLKLINALKIMAPYVGEIDQVVGQEMFALSNHIDDMVDRIKATSNSIKHERNLLDAKKGQGSRAKLSQMEASLKSQLADLHSTQLQASTYMTKLMTSPEAWTSITNNNENLKDLDLNLKSTMKRAFAASGKSWKQRAFESKPTVDFQTITGLLMKSSEFSKDDIIKQLGRTSDKNGVPARLNEINEALQALAAQKQLVSNALKNVTEGALFDDPVYDQLNVLNVSIDKKVASLKDAALQMQKFIAKEQQVQAANNIFGGIPWIEQKADDDRTLEKLTKQLATVKDPDKLVEIKAQYDEVMKRSQRRNAEMSRLRLATIGREPTHQDSAIKQQINNQIAASKDYDVILRDVISKLSKGSEIGVQQALTTMHNHPNTQSLAREIISSQGGLDKAAAVISDKTSQQRMAIDKYLEDQVLLNKEQLLELQHISGRDKTKVQLAALKARRQLKENNARSLGELPADLRDSVSADIQNALADVNSDSQLLKESTARGRLTIKIKDIKEQIASTKEKLMDNIGSDLEQALKADLAKLQTQLKILMPGYKPESVIDDLRNKISSLTNEKASQSVAQSQSQTALQEKQVLMTSGSLNENDITATNEQINAIKAEIQARQNRIDVITKEINVLKGHISTSSQDLNSLNSELAIAERNIESLAIAERDRLMIEEGLSSKEAFTKATQSKNVQELIAQQQSLLAQKQQLSSLFKGQQINDLEAINHKISIVRANIAKMISGNDDKTSGVGSLSKRLKIAQNEYGDELKDLLKQRKAINDVAKLGESSSGSGGVIGGRYGKGLLGTVTRTAMTLGSFTFIFSQVRSALQGLIQPGLQFASSMETSRVGLASILVSLTSVNRQSLSWAQGMALAGDTVSKVQQSALLTGQDAADLLKLTQGLMSSGLSGNMSIDQIVKFATVGSTAIRQIGMDSSQMIQELRDMVQGGIQPQSSILATNLGLTDADVARARAAGNLYQVLMERMKGFQMGIDSYMDTMEGKFNIITAGLTKTASIGMKPLFNVIDAALTGIINELFIINKEAKTMTPQAWLVDGLRAFTTSVVDAIQDVKKLGTALGKALDVTTQIIPLQQYFKLLQNISSWATGDNSVNSAIGMIAGVYAAKRVNSMIPNDALPSMKSKDVKQVGFQVVGAEATKREMNSIKSAFLSVQAAIVTGFIPAIKGMGSLTGIFASLTIGVKGLTRALMALTSRTIIGAIVTIVTMLASDAILWAVEKLSGASKDTSIKEKSYTEIKSRSDFEDVVQERGSKDQKDKYNALIEERNKLNEQFAKLDGGLNVDQYKEQMAQNLEQAADITLQIYKDLLNTAIGELQTFANSVAGKAKTTYTVGGQVMISSDGLSKEEKAQKAAMEEKVAGLQAQVDKIQNLKDSSAKEAIAMTGVQAKNRQLDSQELEALKGQEDSFWQQRINNAAKVAEEQIAVLKNQLEIANNKFKTTINEYYKKRFEYEDQLYQARINQIDQQMARSQKLYDLNMSANNSAGVTTSGNKDLDKIVDEASQLTGVSKRLIYAVMKQESNNQHFNSNGGVLTSSAGALGLMQLMPDTAAGLGVDPLNIRENVIGGAKYLGQLLDMFNGDVTKAIAAYNAGPGAVQSGAASTYSETRNYVQQVLANYGAGTSDNAKQVSISTDSNAVSRVDQLLTSENVIGNAKAYQILQSVKDILGSESAKTNSVTMMTETIKNKGSMEDLQNQKEILTLQHQQALESLKAEMEKAQNQVQRTTMQFWAQFQETFGKVDLKGYWGPLTSLFKGPTLDNALNQVSDDWYGSLQQLDFSAVPDDIRTRVYNDFISFTEQYVSVIKNSSDEARPKIIASLKKMFAYQESEKLWELQKQRLDATASQAETEFKVFAEALSKAIDTDISAKNWGASLQNYLDQINPELEQIKERYKQVLDTFGNDKTNIQVLNVWSEYISKLQQMNALIAQAADGAYDAKKAMFDAKQSKDWTVTDKEKTYLDQQYAREHAPEMNALYDQQIDTFGVERDKSLQGITDKSQIDLINQMYDNQINAVRIKKVQLEAEINDQPVHMFGQDLWVTWSSVFKECVSGMSQALVDWAQGTKTASEAFREMAYNIISYMQQIVAEMLAKAAMTAIFKAIGLPLPEIATGGHISNGKVDRTPNNPIRKYSVGGSITGPGTGTSDDILAWLSNGEFVLKANAVRKYGVDILHRLNAGMIPKNALLGFATGGIVSKEKMNKFTKGLGTSTVIPKFAVGGFVGKEGASGLVQDAIASTNQSASSANGVNIVNIVDPNMVNEFMSSSKGNKVLLNVIENNRKTIRRILV